MVLKPEWEHVLKQGGGLVHVVVFGSINMDLVARTPRLPLPGETITGHTFQTSSGGKGANQAVACARLGARAFMVGRVGGDLLGARLKTDLQAADVDVSLVEMDAEVSSGVAVITVDDQAENSIIVIPGANARVGEADLDRLELVLDQAGLLLLQLEIPLESVLVAAKMAKAKGTTVILDPAPAQSLPDELYRFIDILTPNETEATALVGFAIKNQADAALAAQAFLERGTRQIIVKMGKRGVYAANARAGAFHPAIPVVAVDTIAAGDAFNGALAVALLEGKSFEEAVRWGLAGAAVAVTKQGAQAAMPNRQELFTLLEAYIRDHQRGKVS